mmetsp:Transcript_24286/g.26084  ORF Transcript_24286/g.26084 Transcript_24286/m.26084 type:complete len:544 (-) Transcript_24286:3431-5062(-)
MNSTAKTKNHYYIKNTHLLLLLSIAVLLYGVIWIFTSTLINLAVIQQSQTQTQAQAQAQAQQLLKGTKQRQSSSRQNKTISTTNSIVTNIGNGNDNSTVLFLSRQRLNTNYRNHDYNEDKNNVVFGNEKPFLTYQLHYDKPYQIRYGNNTKCIVGVKTNKFGRKPIKRVALNSLLSSVLNVTTTVQTNLKIISVGDSVGIQFHELLEEALQPPLTKMSSDTDNILTSNRKSGNNYHVVYQNAWGNHESVSVSGPVSGGGVVAALRMTGLLLYSGKNGNPPNEPPNGQNGAGGWLPEHIQQILKHNYTITKTAAGTKTTKSTTATVESFDAMIFRIPHGWLPLKLITRERLEASLLLARELFGINTTIVQTLPLNNNVKSMEDLIELSETNLMIRDLVEASWKNKELPDLLLMDFGGWTDKLTNLNARLAGMNQTAANYTLERLGCARFPPSIAMSCVHQVNKGSCTCTRNMLSIDGMHWCMETLGGRIIAMFACLLQCSLLPQENNSNNDDKIKIFRGCQTSCNDQFMSLREASSLSTTAFLV